MRNFTFLKRLLFLCTALIITGTAWGQDMAEEYLFSASSGTYTEISGGTMLVNGTSNMDSEAYLNQEIGFNFEFNGVVYTQFSVTTNGFITFGTTQPAGSLTSPISGTTAYDGAISPFGRDLNKTNSDATSEMRFELSGVAPNQVLTVQWKNVKRYNIAGENLNFQVKLYETTNVAEIVYGVCVGGSSTSYPQVGLRGTTNTNYFNRTTTTDWAATTAGTTNAATCLINTTIFPATGQTYTFTPAPPKAIDAGVTAIVAPISGATGMHNVVATLENFGTTNLTACDIIYDINGVAGTYSWTGDLATEATENVTILTAYDFTVAGPYVIEVSSDLTGDEKPSNDSVVKTVNMATPYTIPLVEGFEANQIHNTAVGLPILQESVIGTTVWTANNTLTTYNRTPRTGSFNAYLANSNTDWMFLPVELVAGTTYKFSTWARQNTATAANSSISVSYGTTATAVAMTNTIVALTPIINGGYQEVAGYFTVPSTGVYYIGILGTLDTPFNYISLDDISVTEAVSLDAGITAIVQPSTGLTGNYDVVVTLKNFGTTNLTACDIDYDINGVAGTYSWTGDLALDASADVTILPAYDFTVAGSYTIQVSSNLTGDGNAANDGVTKTIQLVAPYTVPFVEGFEAGQTDQVAVGSPITQISITGSGVWTANSTLTTYNRTPRTGSFNAYLQYSNTDWMFLPVQLEAGTSYNFSAWARQDGATGANASITVSYGTDATVAAMANSIVALTPVINGDYQEIAGSFTVAADGVYYIGILGTINGSPWYISLDDISVTEVAAIDAGITAITQPNSGLTGNYDVIATLTNFGVTNLTACNINYDINGTTGTYSWTGNLAFEATEDVTILTAYDFTVAGDYIIEVSSDLAGDENAANDGVTKTVVLYTPIIPNYMESFEDLVFPPANWTNTSSGANAWERTTFVSYDGTASTYFNCYNSSTGMTAQLKTPVISIPNDGSSYKFSFAVNYFLMEGTWGNASQLYLDILDQNNVALVTGTTNLISGQHGAGWLEHEMDLTAYAGQFIKFNFRGISDYGSYSIAIDKVAVTKVLATDATVLTVTDLSCLMGGTVTPLATVKNAGLSTETFDATVTIKNSLDEVVTTETISVVDLAAGATFDVTFADYTPLAFGEYTVDVTVNLTGDMDATNNTAQGILRVLNPENIAYAYTIYNEGTLPSNAPVYFDLDFPEVLVPIADHSTDTYTMRGGEWIDGIWYGFDRTTTVNRFLTIDPATGDKTVIASTGITYAPSDIAYDYTTNTLFGIVSFSGGTFGLYSIDLTNGALTQIGTSSSGAPLTLACNLAGQLYSISTDGNLYTIDKTTGVATVVGATGVTGVAYVQSMAFDHRNGDVLYWNQQGDVVYVGSFFTVNTTTGVATLVGDLQGNAELVGFAIPYALPVNYDVTFSVIGSNGTLAATVGGTEITSPAEVEEGSEVIFTATPDANYQVKEWVLDGTVVPANTTNTYTLTNLAANATVTVEFEEISATNYTVTLTVVDAEGAIEGATVNFDGVEYTTDVDGIVVIADVIDGTYAYTVSMATYQNATGEIVVDGADVEQTITLVLTGIGLESLSNIKVYPNPFSSYINITNADKVNRVIITNVIGQRVMDITLNGRNNFNASELTNGVYLVTFEGINGERTVRRMIKK